jgi:hypothetical protein
MEGWPARRWRTFASIALTGACCLVSTWVSPGCGRPSAAIARCVSCGPSKVSSESGNAAARQRKFFPLSCRQTGRAWRSLAADEFDPIPTPVPRETGLCCECDRPGARA